MWQRKTTGFSVGVPAARDAHDEVHLAGIGSEQVHVVGRKTGIEEALLHGRGRGGHVARGRIRGVDLDEFLENCAGQCPVIGAGSGQRALGKGGRDGAYGKGKDGKGAGKVASTHERIVSPRCRT